jgi:RNA polymerase sigma factor (sigma-70 family)
MGATVMARRASGAGMSAVRTSADVLRALDGLRPEHRAVLLQVHCHGRTVAEAAQRLGLPVETVKFRVSHALRELRHALDEGRESAL